MKGEKIKISEARFRKIVESKVRKMLRESDMDDRLKGIFGGASKESFGLFDEIEGQLAKLGEGIYISKFFSDPNRIMVMTRGSNTPVDDIVNVMRQYGYTYNNERGIDWMQFRKGESNLEESAKTRDKDPMKRWFKDMDDAQKVRDTMDYVVKGGKNPIKKTKSTELNETQLRKIVAENVKKVLREHLSDKELQDYYGDEYTSYMAKRNESKKFLLSVYPDYPEAIEEYVDGGYDNPQASKSLRIASFEKFMENNGYFPL